MATAVDTRTWTRALEPEQRFLIPRVGWEGYESMLKIVGDRSSIRITYDRGDLELMSPSRDHEVYKTLLGRMIEILTMELDIPCQGVGSTTWRKRLEDRGLESDECYYLASSDRVVGKKTLDLNVDPPPDLAVEVEITTSALDRMGIYAALGVPVVWRFDGDVLRIEQLQPDGTYAEVPVSPSFPFWPPEAIVRRLDLAENADQTLWARQFRAWVLKELAPRRQGP